MNNKDNIKQLKLYVAYEDAMCCESDNELVVSKTVADLWNSLFIDTDFLTDYTDDVSVDSIRDLCSQIAEYKISRVFTIKPNALVFKGKKIQKPNEKKTKKS